MLMHGSIDINNHQFKRQLLVATYFRLIFRNTACNDVLDISMCMFTVRGFPMYLY